jgi:hypothetical protein
LYFICFSVSTKTFFIVLTASIGYFQAAVSQESIVQSAFCIHALKISVTSALVGIGFSTIVSSICVATIKYFPACLHLFAISLWTEGRVSKGISAHKSHLAIIIQSLSSIISSRLSRASLFSILEII